MVCGKRIMRMNRDGKEVDAPGFSQECRLEEKDHDGPCASPSDLHSTQMRQKWEKEQEERLADKRHADSGLAEVQSRPMPVSSIVEGRSLMPHPNAATKCPFCSDKPMFKNLSQHIAGHAAESQIQEEAKTTWKNHSQVISSWILGVQGYVRVPDDVLDAVIALDKIPE
jgi:hypothetical protein